MGKDLVNDNIASDEPSPEAAENIEVATVSDDVNNTENTTEERDISDTDAPAIVDNNEEKSDAQTDNKIPPLSKKEKVLKYSKFYILLVILALTRAFTTYMFIIPNGFAPGGIGGISTIIYKAVLPYNEQLATTWLDPGLTTFLMNIPILITAMFVLNKRFAFNSLLVVSIYSGFVMLLGKIGCPTYDAEGDTGLQIIAALVGGATCGLCLGIMLRNNMSMAGTDIIGKIIHKRNPVVGAQWYIIICDCVVAAASGILGILNVKGVPDMTATRALTEVLSPILFSFISLIVCSIIADIVQAGFQSSLVFNIITDKPDQIAQLISQKLHRGVTVSKAIGYYTGIEHEVLLCVVSKRQINNVKNIIDSVDPKAFTYITKAREVAGKGFRHDS